jgi:hypothetical protein
MSEHVANRNSGGEFKVAGVSNIYDLTGDEIEAYGEYLRSIEPSEEEVQSALTEQARAFDEREIADGIRAALSREFIEKMNRGRFGTIDAISKFNDIEIYFQDAFF